MAPTSALRKLRGATSLHDVAALLGYKPSALAFLLYRLRPEYKYKTFDIPKKSGSARTINAPSKRIKQLQRRLANVLYQCRTEIESNKPAKPPISHGFRRELSILTNAYPHRGNRYVLNLDLKDFFPTLNFGRVRGFFIKNRDFSLNKDVATILAQIACYQNSLPQGSPCSPIISDLITHTLDVHLVLLARKFGCYYTRYADDLTFSTNNKTFPAEIAIQSRTSGSHWTLGAPLVSVIERAGFVISWGKVRMQCATGRQLVTGLTVNRKVNVRSDYYRTTRAMCHQLFSSGEYYHLTSDRLARSYKSLSIRKTERWLGKLLRLRLLRKLLLWMRYRLRFRYLRPTKPLGPSNIIAGEMNRTTRQLEGRLNHIWYVKDKFDRRTQAEKKNSPSAVRKLYHELLFFRYFVALDRPLVVCEGKTDSIYLKLAIRKLAAKYPSLHVLPSGERGVHFFNYQMKRKDILKLDGGSGCQLQLIRDYKKFMKRYRYAPLLHPVVVLIDNDDGAKSVFKAVKELFGVSASLTSTDPFYHLCHNLYLIKTPEIGAAGVSCIESSFEKSVLETEIRGMKFNPKKEHDAPGEYGKAMFAEQVVASNPDNIDFSNFGPLLDRIEAARKHYSPPKATPVLVPIVATP